MNINALKCHPLYSSRCPIVSETTVRSSALIFLHLFADFTGYERVKPNSTVKISWDAVNSDY
jgi:hypothetical protein